MQIENEITIDNFPIIKSYRHNNVQLSKEIIFAHYELSLAEKQCLYIALAKIDQSIPIDPDEWQIITVEEFAALRGTRLEHARQALLFTRKLLWERTLTYQTEKGCTGGVRWISSHEILEDGTGIRFKFSHDIIPMLSELKHFGTISMLELQRLNDKHSLRFFEFCCLGRAWYSHGVLDFKIEELYEILQIPAASRNFGTFNRDVLVKIKTALNRTGIVEIGEIEVRKKGKRVEGVRVRYGKVGEVVKIAGMVR